MYTYHCVSLLFQLQFIIIVAARTLEQTFLTVWPCNYIIMPTVSYAPSSFPLLHHPHYLHAPVITSSFPLSVCPFASGGREGIVLALHHQLQEGSVQEKTTRREEGDLQFFYDQAVPRQAERGRVRPEHEWSRQTCVCMYIHCMHWCAQLLP